MIETSEWTIGKAVSAISGTILVIIDPVANLMIIAIEFIFIDFIIGVWASRTRAKRQDKLKEWGFESDKAWKTIYKLVFVLMGILMAYQLDSKLLTFKELYLANIFAGFVCGVEFWSFLENAACISDHPIFRWLRNYMGKKVKDAGIDPEDVSKAYKGEEPEEDYDSKDKHHGPRPPRIDREMDS